MVAEEHLSVESKKRIRERHARHDLLIEYRNTSQSHPPLPSRKFRIYEKL